MIERVLFTRSAEKDLRRLDDRHAVAVVAALELYVEDGSGDVKPLTGFAGAFRLRVGNYRVAFVIISRRPVVIQVVEVVKRGDAYRKKTKKRIG